jgi:hypothetical protein
VAALGCSPFEFGAENETQWGDATLGEVSLNVSRPYEDGTLREWDSSVPEGFDVGISIRGADSVAVLARAIAKALGARVVHHRTWIAPGQSTDRNDVYDP